MNFKFVSSIVGLIICILLCNLVAVVIAKTPEDSYNWESEATEGYKTEELTASKDTGPTNGRIP